MYDLPKQVTSNLKVALYSLIFLLRPQLNVNFVGWRLSHHIIATHDVKDNGECLKECIDNIDCKSYNYKYGEIEETKRCELNNITRKNYDHFMTSEYGFAYYEDENVIEAPVSS